MIEALKTFLVGWLAILVIALLIRWLDRLHNRWEIRQHQRHLGRVPPRRAS